MKRKYSTLGIMILSAMTVLMTISIAGCANESIVDQKYQVEEEIIKSDELVAQQEEDVEQDKDIIIGNRAQKEVKQHSEKR